MCVRERERKIQRVCKRERACVCKRERERVCEREEKVCVRNEIRKIEFFFERVVGFSILNNNNNWLIL